MSFLSFASLFLVFFSEKKRCPQRGFQDGVGEIGHPERTQHLPLSIRSIQHGATASSCYPYSFPSPRSLCSGAQCFYPRDTFFFCPFFHFVRLFYFYFPPLSLSLSFRLRLFFCFSNTDRRRFVMRTVPSVLRRARAWGDVAGALSHAMARHSLLQGQRRSLKTQEIPQGGNSGT